MSATVVETTTGAQVLPRVKGKRARIDERATINSWEGHCAMDADLRIKSAAHRVVASKLHIEQNGSSNA